MKIRRDFMKALKRSLTNRVFAGVCGGFADYFGISAVWLRIAFAVALFTPLRYLAIFIYLALMVLIPNESVINFKRTFFGGGQGTRQRTNPRQEAYTQREDDVEPVYRDLNKRQIKEVEKVKVDHD
ncbi:PspC domain-containing protein [Aerococcus tenax]|nr:PspC domain-containing protein [Aerococcus tenax]RAV92497.1 PspC domain-containing protein [Aerococcus tenax]